MARKDKTSRISALCERLNRERYAAGIGATKRGFVPCAKSLIYLAAMLPPGTCLPPALDGIGVDSTTPMLVLHNLAAMTICECHPTATANDLLRWEYDSPATGEGE